MLACVQNFSRNGRDKMWIFVNVILVRILPTRPLEIAVSGSGQFVAARHIDTNGDEISLKLMWAINSLTMCFIHDRKSDQDQETCLIRRQS
jgi:hypothetical protein